MRKVRRLLLVLVGLVLSAGTSGASTHALAQTDAKGVWVEIGMLPDPTAAEYPAPIFGGGTGLVAIPAKRHEPPAVTSLALGARWPEDGLLFALQQTGWIQRTRDAGATEGYPFGEGALVFKVGGKVFAILADNAVSLKCDPGLAVALRETYPAVTPGYHLNKRHWNTVRLDGTVPGDVFAEWIEDSYDLAMASLTRAQQAALQRGESV
jgi:predicted DNA-binding protein (MmcQ/YjbR family)